MTATATGRTTEPAGDASSGLVGSPVRRVEDRRLLTGTGRYIANLVLPRMLHAVFVRSPVAHGVVRRLDADAARHAPGVVAVITAAELEGTAGWLTPTPPPGLSAPSFPPLVPVGGKVRFVGDPLAFVVAGSPALALDAAELVDIDIDELPAVTDMDEALRPGAPPVFDEAGSNLLYRQRFAYGDPEGVMARARAEGGLVKAETFRQHRVTNAPMEGHVGVADFAPASGELVYHTANQNPHALRHHLAALLGLPVHLVRVLCGDIGGSFGQKAYPTVKTWWSARQACCSASPCRWVADRRENLIAGGQAREETLEVEAAVDAAGRLAAFSVRMTVDAGAYPLVTLPATSFAMMARALFPSAYRLEHYSFESVVVSTNKATAVPYRGPWEAETWARERMIDLLARTLGRDPVEYRLANLWADDELPRPMVNGPDLLGITVRRTLERARDLVSYPSSGPSRPSSASAGRHLGVGFSCSIDASPGPPNFGTALSAGATPRGHQQADARLETDGSVTISTSQQPHGQGHETTLAQLAAEQLQVPLGQVRVVHGDTSATPFNMVGTGGSRAAAMASGAVLGATQRPARADRRHRRPRPRSGARGPRGGRRSGAGARRAEPGPRPGRRGPHRLFPARRPATRHAAAGPGDLRLHQRRRGMDPGDPCLRRGGGPRDRPGAGAPLRGGGRRRPDSSTPPSSPASWLAAWCRASGRSSSSTPPTADDGQPLATSFADYLLPTAVDVPQIEVHHVQGLPTSEVDFRGVGECGAVGSPAALTNAIEDALSPFGCRIVEQYLPPSRVVSLVAGG